MKNEKDTGLIFGVNKKKRPSWEQSKFFFQVLKKKEKIIVNIAVGLFIASLIFLVGFKIILLDIFIGF